MGAIPQARLVRRVSSTGFPRLPSVAGGLFHSDRPGVESATAAVTALRREQTPTRVMPREACPGPWGAIPRYPGEKQTAHDPCSLRCLSVLPSLASRLVAGGVGGTLQPRPAGSAAPEPCDQALRALGGQDVAADGHSAAHGEQLASDRRLVQVTGSHGSVQGRFERPNGLLEPRDGRIVAARGGRDGPPAGTSPPVFLDGDDLTHGRKRMWRVRHELSNEAFAQAAGPIAGASRRLPASSRP
jgi:hypothetical protein